MGKKMLRFIFSITSSALANTGIRSHRESGRSNRTAPGCSRLMKVAKLFRYKPWAPIIHTALLAGVIVGSFAGGATASEVTLSWNDNNSKVDGYRIFKRAEGQDYNYSTPAWPTDGRDHVQTSCTISGLEEGVRYYFAARAYAGNNQSGDSNEVTYKAPAPSPETIVNDSPLPDGQENSNPPEQPMLTSITAGESNVSPTPLLSASEFCDQDPADTHAGTQWRIFRETGDRGIVFDRTCDKSHLLDLRVPPMVLEPSTGYSVQVRFFDGRWMPSPWSQPVAFTTAPDEKDRNRNNIPDNQEILADMDMNGDAISDLEQEFTVKNLTSYDNRHVMSISVELNDPAVQILAAASISPETFASSDETASSAGANMPYGLMGCRIRVMTGEVITVKLNLSDAVAPSRTQWVRHDAANGMMNCDDSSDLDDSGLVVNRYLADGGDEDADGVANGVIVDLSGPQELDVANDGNDSSLSMSDDGPAASGGSSGGCFIRTLY
jgi:hypothetical protein